MSQDFLEIRGARVHNLKSVDLRLPHNRLIVVTGVSGSGKSSLIFDTVYAHKDHCRWRAPDWHVTKVLNENSHRNYHLGFRCCKSLAMQ